MPVNTRIIYILFIKQYFLQVIASDADSGPSGEVTYSFVPDKGSDLFTVHPKAGSIFARQKLTAGEAYDFIVSILGHSGAHKHSLTFIC